MGNRCNQKELVLCFFSVVELVFLLLKYLMMCLEQMKFGFW